MSRSKSGLCLKAKATALVSATSTGVPRSSTCLDLKTAVRAGRGIRWGHVNERVTKNELFPDLFLYRIYISEYSPLRNASELVARYSYKIRQFVLGLFIFHFNFLYISTSSENMTHLYRRITLIYGRK
jgi:hypothetical protein